MKLTVISGTEEWEGLYIDGVLVHQDHSLRVHEVLELLCNRQEPIAELQYIEVKQDRLNDYGCLPERLDRAIEMFVDGRLP